MTYVLDVYPNAREQIAALPAAATGPLAQVFIMLELTPWSGEPLNRNNPSGAVRTLAFGRGFVTYLVLEDIRRVDVLEILWVG